MQLREYRPADCERLAALFYETVHLVNAADYTPEQLDAWATGTVDLNAWDASFRAHDTVVAVQGDDILGFGDMDDTGYLDRLYVAAAHQREGIATAICDLLEARCGAERFTTHASVTARPFFLQRGYRVVRQQSVVRQGVALTNFVMRKTAEPKLREPSDREALLPALLEVWEASVRETHRFLTEADIARIRGYVPQALRGVPHLLIAERRPEVPVAFLGVDGERLEMLFLAPDERGRGLGRRMLEYAVRHYGVRELTVNAQNPQAIGFYEHMGFSVWKRTELDEAGDPFPLLYMRRNRSEKHDR